MNILTMSSPQRHHSKAVRAFIVACIVLAASLASAQTYTLAPNPYQKVTNSSNVIVPLGCVWTYLVGTTTPATTYQTQNGTANANPIIAGSDGSFVAYLTPGVSYKFVYENVPCSASSHGATIKTVDGIGAVPPSGTNIEVTGTAGESLLANACAYLSDGSGSKTAGLWYNCDADFTYASTTPEIGISTAALTTGSSGSIRLSGQVSGLSGLTLGALYYVSATAGQITSTSPANSRVVGQADSTTTLVLAPNPAPTASATTIQTTTSTGSQNNFAATTARRLVLYANNATALTLTGIAAGAIDGDQIDLIGVGVGTVTLSNQSGSSDPANRIILPNGLDTTVQAAHLEYDIGNARWRVTSLVPSNLVLLKSNSGADGTAGATNVDTVAITGLTAKDTLKIIVTLEAVTQQTADAEIYNSTDSKNLASISAVAIAAGRTIVFETTLQQAHTLGTLVTSRGVSINVSADDTATTGAAAGYRNTVTTQWTGSWTLALRHGGVTAGGSLHWTWSVYRVVGQ